METVEEQLKNIIEENNILLFMKGSPNNPNCGFSARVVAILNEYDAKYSYIDILQNPEVRATLPKVSECPTFPQLFVKGELVGGCDIITEMHNSNELEAVLLG